MGVGTGNERRRSAPIYRCGNGRHGRCPPFHVVGPGRFGDGPEGRLRNPAMRAEAIWRESTAEAEQAGQGGCVTAGSGRWMAVLDPPDSTESRQVVPLWESPRTGLCEPSQPCCARRRDLSGPNGTSGRDAGYPAPSTRPRSWARSGKTARSFPSRRRLAAQPNALPWRRRGRAPTAMSRHDAP